MNAISTQEAVETWKLAHRFVLDVYRLTNRFPREEHYGLIPKVRTSTVKIASNIVEGYSRKSDEFYLQHLSESQAALEETKYSILVARDLGYISEHAYDKTMADAEALGERLDSLNQQLTLATEQAEQPQALPAQEAKGAFHVRKGVRATLRDSWRWLKGGPDRRREQGKDHVWAEEVFPPRGYLGQPGDDDKF